MSCINEMRIQVLSKLPQVVHFTAPFLPHASTSPQLPFLEHLNPYLSQALQKPKLLDPLADPPRHRGHGGVPPLLPSGLRVQGPDHESLAIEEGAADRSQVRAWLYWEEGHEVGGGGAVDELRGWGNGESVSITIFSRRRLDNNEREGCV